MGEERGGVLLEAVGQEEGHTAGRQHLDDLVDYALRHGQRPVPNVDGQQELGDRGHRRPHPVRRAGQAREGLGLTDCTVLDCTEQGEQLIELDLLDVDIRQKMAGKRLKVIRGLHQPQQHRVGIDLKDTRDGADAEPFGQRRDGPHQRVGCDTFAMQRRALGLKKVATTAATMELSPGATAGMAMRADVAGDPRKAGQ
jgi:hypothetical protein